MNRRWSLIFLVTFAGCAASSSGSSSSTPAKPTVWFRSPDGVVSSCTYDGGGMRWLKGGLIGVAQGADGAYEACMEVATSKGWVQVEKP